MSVDSELVEIEEGQGSLLIGGDSYPTAYHVEFTQEVHTYRAGGSEKTLASTGDFSGYLILEELLPYFQEGSATLTMQDGRRLEILLPPRAHATARVDFLGNRILED